MLQPWGKGLLGTTLRYPYEVRADEDYFDEIPETKIPKDMLALAEHILDSKKTLKLCRIMPRDG
jgi:DNA end-binding protein Ku